jgi:alpha-ketoglutarate-dependent taurine dioxygenase
MSEFQPSSSRRQARSIPASSVSHVANSGQILFHSEDQRPGWPLVVESRDPTLSLSEWLEGKKDFVENELLRHGSILFRGFPITTTGHFESAATAAAPELLEYRERSSPRTEVGSRLYTSTDYPADQEIFLHNEHSYAKTFPQWLFFCCLRPAIEGGETPLASTRGIYATISPQIRDRFASKGYMYVRNYGEGAGLAWETAFQTRNRSSVEQYCRDADISFEWRENNCLRTKQRRPTEATHPQTGEMLWFNHLTFFHVSTLPPQLRSELQSIFREEDLPNNTYYGDGSRIEESIVEELREVYRSHTVSFPWLKGDLLLLDNMLTCHGRRSFSGPRQILVAMAKPFTRA